MLTNFFYCQQVSAMEKLNAYLKNRLPRFDEHYFRSYTYYNNDLYNLIKKYDLPLECLHIRKSNFISYYDLINEITNHIQLYLRYKEVLKRFVKKMVCRFRSNLVTREIIARNSKEKKPDVICRITFHPRLYPYFETAFSGRFPTDIEDGRYIVRVNKLNTSQEAVYIYCQKNKAELYSYLNRASLEGIDRLEEVIRELQIGQVFMDEIFVNQIGDFFNSYLNETLYKLNGTTSLSRLNLFVSLNPIIAEYIWKTNFNTPLERRKLGSVLSISVRNLGGFIRSETLKDLHTYIEKKMGSNRSILDQVPKHLYDKIQKAQEDLQTAKCGVRVGLYGRYISSDNIQAANQRLHNVWKEVDRWITQHTKKSSFD